ncbi:MAG: hypothetical protein AAF914_12410 [Pseudomonadota bacterium]
MIGSRFLSSSSDKKDDGKPHAIRDQLVPSPLPAAGAHVLAMLHRRPTPLDFRQTTGKRPDLKQKWVSGAR